MPIIAGGSPGTVEKEITVTADDGTRFTGTADFDDDFSTLWSGYDSDAALLEMHNWLRWLDVTLAKPCTITTSYVKVRVRTGTGQAGSPELKIRGVDQDNPDAPTSGAEFDADPLTDAGVDWDGLWTIDAWNQSPDISTIIQELADSYTIVADAMMLQLRNDHALSGSHYNGCDSYDYGPGTSPPILHIEYAAEPPRPPGYGLDPMIF